MGVSSQSFALLPRLARGVGKGRRQAEPVAYFRSANPPVPPAERRVQAFGWVPKLIHHSEGLRMGGRLLTWCSAAVVVCVPMVLALLLHEAPVSATDDAEGMRVW